MACRSTTSYGVLASDLGLMALIGALLGGCFDLATKPKGGSCSSDFFKVWTLALALALVMALALALPLYLAWTVAGFSVLFFALAGPKNCLSSAWIWFFDSEMGFVMIALAADGVLKGSNAIVLCFFGVGRTWAGVACTAFLPDGGNEILLWRLGHCGVLCTCLECALSLVTLIRLTIVPI